VGDETILIASRFSKAVGDLAALSGDASYAELAKRHGAGLSAVVRRALDAVGAVYEAGTDAVRDWPERRRRVLAQLEAMRCGLDRAGVDADLRRMAAALVALIEPGGGAGRAP
jgi:hypothetical protein